MKEQLYDYTMRQVKRYYMIMKMKPTNSLITRVNRSDDLRSAPNYLQTGKDNNDSSRHYTVPEEHD